MNIRKFMKNSKAISPIFATLILIAIAVIAGVVVYMFTSGTLATMTGGGTAGQEKISVQASSYDSTGKIVTLYAQSTGGPLPPTTGLNIIIKDVSGNTVTSISATSAAWTGGALAKVTSTALTTGLTTGAYTATLVTPAGGSFVSPSFNVP